MMYIVRWLMGHPLIAVWALGVIAILLAMGSGNNEPVQVKKEGLNSDQSKIVKVSSASKNKKELVEKIAVAAPSEVKNVETVDEAIVKKSVGIKQAKAIVKTTPVKIPGDTEVSMPKKKVPEVSDLRRLDIEEMLQMAREAYWNNGLDEAAQIYTQLIKQEPEVLEHKGELGNVYWRQGYPKKAAELYSEVAVPMIEQGNPERVINMIGFIEKYFPDRAAVIVDRLERLKK